MKLIYYIWNFIERFGTNLISFVGTIILSYILSPADFGLVGIVAVFTSVIWVLIDCGLADSLLMYKEPSERDFNTVFVFNFAMGVALCLVYIAIAPLIARFFGRDEIIIIMTCMGISAVFSGLSLAQIAKVRSKLQFRLIAVINIGAISSALCIAIIMAMSGFGYFALVELQVGFSVMYFLGLVLFTDWKIKFEFDKSRFRKFWNFGFNLFISYSVIQISKNIYTFVLGKYYSFVEAGYLGQAQKIQETPTNSLEISISNTSYILIAKKNNNDEKNHAIISSFNAMTFVNSVLIFFLICMSSPIIKCILAEKWYPIIPYLQAISILGLISPIENFTAIVFKIYDKTSVIRNIQVLEKGLIILFVFLMIDYGIFAMIFSNIVIAFVALIIYIFKAHSITGISFLKFSYIYLKNIFLALVAASPAYLISLLLNGSHFLALLLGSIVYAIAIGFLCYFFKRDMFMLAKSKLLRAKKVLIQ